MDEYLTPMHDLEDLARELACHGWTVRLEPKGRRDTLPSAHVAVSSRRSRPTEYLLCRDERTKVTVWVCRDRCELRPVGEAPDAEAAHAVLRRDSAALRPGPRRAQAA